VDALFSILYGIAITTKGHREIEKLQSQMQSQNRLFISTIQALSKPVTAPFLAQV
jgi:hypothetical protein